MKQHEPTHYLINPKLFTKDQLEELYNNIEKSPGYQLALRQHILESKEEKK